MKNLRVALGAAFVLAAASFSSASAAPITGNLNMFGDFQPMIGLSSTQDLSLATAVDFLPGGGGTGTFITGTGTGALAAFASSLGGVIKDFTFSPFASVNGFYTITVGGSTLSFDLSALSIANQNTTFLTMSGFGTLHLTGFDDTPGNWNFSGQSSNGNAPQATFSWSAGSSATSVPEPMTLSLLGLGLLALAYGKRQKA
jgi:hypothetical protein